MLRSFPRKRESGVQNTGPDMPPWIPACAGMSGIGVTVRLLPALLVLLVLCASAVALNFPALSGRIVDQANIIPADTRAAIEPKLVDLEAKSGIQLVVATV